MHYRRSKEIERRLEAVLRLIRLGRHSTQTISKEVRVSIPTVSRCVHALRDRGHIIKAKKHRDGWRYVLVRNGKSSKSAAESRLLADGGRT